MALTNATRLNITLPLGSTVMNAVFMVNGTTTVSLDYVTAVRP